MAKRLEFQIQGSSTNFSFDVEGSFTPSIQAIYKEAADPPEVAELRHAWEFRGCKIVSSDGTQATLWDEWLAFVARFENRDSFPTYARLVRDPAGAAVEEWKLDGTTYEQLRVESISAGPEDLPPGTPSDAHFRTVVGVTIVVSAVRKFADSTTGIVTFDQVVSESYRSGLRTLEWRTRVKTKSGTSAKAKALAYAGIDITSLDATYTYDTGNDTSAAGVDVTVLDADEQAGRVPTLVEAVSRVVQWGVAIGASGAGTAPDEVDTSVTTVRTSDETRTITTAFARGPNAEQFVLSQKPGGNLVEDETEVRGARNEARGRWVKSAARNPSNPSNSRKISVQITGGKRVVRDRPVAGGHPALIQRGGFLALRCEVRVSVTRQGGTGQLDELKLPVLLGEPWVLDPGASREGLPEVEGEIATDPNANKWRREALLVYVASEPPQQDPLTELAAGDGVPTYFLT